ncbi:ser/Thr protein phosphatase family [Astrocystis sublimbata]|nr:ser/Thr protein phosphatase family [Astrocystis sublimbata]
MIRRAAALAASLATIANGAQPNAPAPINFLHTTDTHGWIGGHLQESQYSADWGDYVSFTEHMRRKADEKGVDLLIIDTGDRVEGNGLYDSSDPKGKYIYDIFGQQSIDVMCTGNHELYQPDTTMREHNITVPHYGKSYVASNLDYIEPETGNQIPQAQRYIKFKTKNQGYNVVALGFIFDFNRNANNSVVVPVAESMKQAWFQKAIREKPDIFVVAGHNWDTPIVFLGGHAHVRDTRKFDDKAVAIASGRYFETIGWMSVDGVNKAKSTNEEDDVSVDAAVKFTRRYIDNNVLGLQHHAGIDAKNFSTPLGRNVTAMITEARSKLDLDQIIGCAPSDLWMTRAAYPSDGSIFSWLEKEVIPASVINEARADKARLMIVNTGAVRFDVFQGPFTRDSTFLISPFTSKWNYIPDVPYAVAKKVLQLLNSAGPVFEAELDTKYLSIPEMMAPSPFLGKQSSLKSYGESGSSNQYPLSGATDMGEESTTGDNIELIDGYTTTDDLGDDGDDADEAEEDGEVQADPATVDLVFIDYVQPWIIPALKFSGGDYGTDNITVYSNATLTEAIKSWVGEQLGQGLRVYIIASISQAVTSGFWGIYGLLK